MIATSLRIALLIAAAAAGLSCHTHRSFEHYSVLFEVPLNGAPKQVYGTEIFLKLLTIDYKEQACLFRITNGRLGESKEERVALRAYFQSAPWLGSRGLRLDEIRDDRALVRVFGVQ